MLLDQKLIAGIGNVYRAELLFVGHLDPHRAGRDVARSDLERLWRNTVTLLQIGAKHNAIRVVGEATEGPWGGEHIDPADHEVRSRYGPKKDRLWVYKRPTCKLCGGAIQTGELAARTLYWCPSCQSGRPGTLSR
jgi:endonuclease-8